MRFLIFSLLFSIAQAQTYFDPNGPIYQDALATPLEHRRPTLKVVSFNINFSRKLPEVFALLKMNEYLRNADVILLQEVIGEPGGSSNTAAYLAQRLKMNYVFIPAQIHPKLGKDYGSAILSPWPIDKVQKILLPGAHLRWKTHRAVVKATITVGKNPPINVYSAHLENLFWDTLSSDERSRALQVSTLLAYVPKSAPAIIGGDFNAVNPSGMVYLFSLFWWDGFKRASSLLPTENKIPIGIDHIFTRGMRILDYGIVYDFSAGDHAPIWAELSAQ